MVDQVTEDPPITERRGEVVGLQEEDCADWPTLYIQHIRTCVPTDVYIHMYVLTYVCMYVQAH